MELFTAIALLCQLNANSIWTSQREQLKCHQYYSHCVNIKSISLSKEEALNKCILERKFE